MQAADMAQAKAAPRRRRGPRPIGDVLAEYVDALTRCRHCGAQVLSGWRLCPEHYADTFCGRPVANGDRAARAEFGEQLELILEVPAER
jgi:hypothetical protein